MEFLHIVNRGVEKRDIVLDDSDRLRFIHDLYALNDRDATPNYILSSRHIEKTRRDCLVYIHAFSLMANHYHLLLSPRVTNGVSLFMQKFNMGYAKYFNERYQRSGVLWQGKYRKTHVKNDSHFMYVPYYIHLNPLDLKYPKWRQGAIKNGETALEFLEKYRWSSHLDYLGKANFPSIIYKKVLKPEIGLASSYKKEIKNLISDAESPFRNDAFAV